MKKNKNIDDFFKDQLGSFEATPSPEVWDNIEAQLKKKKEDRKVIPLWWKLGGVAAVLALLLSISGVFNSNKMLDNNNTIVEEQVKDSEKEGALEKEEMTNVVTDNSDAIGVEENASEKDKSFDAINESVSNKLKTNPNNAVTTSNKIQNKKEKIDRKNSSVVKNTSIKEAVAVIDDSKTNTKSIDSKLKETNIIEDTSKKESVAVTSEKDKKIEKEDLKEPPFKEKDPIISPNNSSEDAIANEEKVEKTEKDIPTENKKSIFDAIEENKEAIAQKEEKSSNPYWEVTPNVGPVFYNSIDGGSSISPSFADNPQSGDANISYGVQVSYNVNDRLSVRTGINNVSLGYATGDVVLATSPTEVALKSINYDNTRGNVLTAFDKGELENIPSDPNNPFSQVTQKSTGGNAEIIQNISYFEVPMELKYALVNKRFGVNMIGGFSTLFLGNNEISVADGDFRSVLGEANNLNSMSFSTNIGLGFDYKISKRFKFNIEPIFKYQLNPYNSSVDFNPYYFGIYSGLSFKF